jgi:hypothetical protein
MTPSFDATLTGYRSTAVSREELRTLIGCIDRHYAEHLDAAVTTKTILQCARGPPATAWTLQRVDTLPKRIWVTVDAPLTTLASLVSFIEKYPWEDRVVYRLSPDAAYPEGDVFTSEIRALNDICPELRELDALVGLADLKQTLLDQILYFVQHLHQGKVPGGGDYKHTILYGPPGTGKTEIAQLIGSMYAKIGILQNRVFRKVTRADLVAGYLGQTAIKTQTVIEECLGGCLFIDEVYALGTKKDGNSDSFSKECIDTLCEAMSRERDQLMVIVAGYEEDVKEQFLDANKGLASRFVWRFTLDTYTVAELRAIFLKKVAEGGWRTEDEVPTLAWFEQRREQFTHNGRDMETLLMYAKIAHGRRVFGKTADVRRKLNTQDLDDAFATFKRHRGENKAFTLPFGLYT